MNEGEKQVLHGLYCHIGVGNAVCIKPSEIFWLIKTPLPGGRHWRKENEGLKSSSAKVGDWLGNLGATSAATEKALQYLEQSGFISVVKKGGHFEISVSSLGADIARELDSLWGRWNLRYKQHRDGLLGLLITVAVSFVVSVLTTLVTTEAIWKIWKK